MKTLREMIEVMEECKRGEEIQQKLLSPASYPWVQFTGKFNWSKYDYRKKPKLKTIFVNEYNSNIEGYYTEDLAKTSPNAMNAVRIAVEYQEVIKEDD